MAVDYSKRDRVAIVIGAQTEQGSINAFVEDATAGIPGEADATGGTSVLSLAEDVNFGFSRVASDPTNYGATYYQKPGSLIRIEPTLSFSIPMRGGLFTDTPDLDESRALIFAGAGIGVNPSDVVPDTEDPSLFTSYNLAPFGVKYQTIKLWRGDECWVFGDCFYNLAMSFEANEYAPMQVEVFAGSSDYYGPTTLPAPAWDTSYPSSMGYQEYLQNPSNYSDLTPSLNLAAMSIGSDNRPLTSGSITVSNTTASIPDSNAPEGVIVSPEGRTVEFSGTFIEESDSTQSEYDYLASDGVGSSEMPSISFGLGRAWDQAGQGIANSLFFGINSARITGVDKASISADRVANTISGYAATTGSGTDIPFYIRGR